MTVLPLSEMVELLLFLCGRCQVPPTSVPYALTGEKAPGSNLGAFSFGGHQPVMSAKAKGSASLGVTRRLVGCGNVVWSHW